MRSILIVDDESDVGAMISALLSDLGWESACAESANEALSFLRRRDFDAVLSDVRMPEKTGIELVSDLREVRPSTPVLLMTAFSSIDSAVEGMRAIAAWRRSC